MFSVLVAHPFSFYAFCLFLVAQSLIHYFRICLDKELCVAIWFIVEDAHNSSPDIWRDILSVRTTPELLVEYSAGAVSFRDPAVENSKVSIHITPSFVSVSEERGGGGDSLL